MSKFYIYDSQYTTPPDNKEVSPEFIKKIEQVASKIESDRKAGKYSSLAQNVASVSPKESFKIVSNFLKETGRKVYGGTALNSYLPQKDSIYARTDFPDFDFFSPDPWADAVELTDRLYKAGFIYSEAKSGIHRGTFKVFANFWPVADITFLPQKLYDNITTQKKRGYTMVSPAYLQMTLYDIISKPIETPTRWPKVALRQKLLEKWAAPKYRDKQCAQDFIRADEKTVLPNNTVMKALEHIYRFARKNKLIHYGALAYNKYLEIGAAEYRIPLYFYELLTIDAEEMTTKLDAELKSILGKEVELIVDMVYTPYKDMNNVSYIEYMLVEDHYIPIFIMTELTRCIPYKYLNGRYYCSIDYLKYELYNQMFNESTGVHEYNVGCLIRYLDWIQHRYYATHGITELDPSPFQRFVTKCRGPFVDVLREEFYSRWLEKAEQRAKIIDVLPIEENLTLEGVQGQKVRVYPADFIEPPECKGLSKNSCRYPCNWVVELNKCGGIPLTGYQPGQKHPVKMATTELKINKGAALL